MSTGCSGVSGQLTRSSISCVVKQEHRFDFPLIHDAMICWPSPDHFLWFLPVTVQCPRLLQEVMMFSSTSLTEQPDAVDHSRAFWDSCNLRVRVLVLYMVYPLLVCISNLLVGRSFWKSSQSRRKAFQMTIDSNLCKQCKNQFMLHSLALIRSGAYDLMVESRDVESRSYSYH